MQAFGIVSKWVQQTALLSATVSAALHQTSCAFPSGSSEHFPVLPSEPFPSTARVPFPTQQEWDGTKGYLNSSLQPAKVSEEHKMIIMFKPSRKKKIHSLFNTFILSQTLVLKVTECLILTSTNEAKKLLLANLVLRWDGSETFQVLLHSAQIKQLKIYRAFVWKKPNHSIECYIVFAEMPINELNYCSFGNGNPIYIPDKQHIQWCYGEHRYPQCWGSKIR